MKLYQLLCSTLLILLLSCNSIDKSNPEAVVKAYAQFVISNNSKGGYDLISTKSKEVVTYDEFKKVFTANDSTGYKILKVDKIEEQEKDLNYPTYRRFKISATSIIKSDTILNKISYVTLINENNEWKRVWNKTLLIVADEKFRKGDYDGAINLLNKAIELSPFDAYAYNRLAWCYKNSDKINNTSTRQETLDKITSSLKHAISLEPDIPSHYNAIAAYYEQIDNPDLAIEYLKKGLNLVTYKFDKIPYLANIGLNYKSKNDFNTAKRYFNDALDIDPTDDFALYNLGKIYNDQGNYPEAIKYFERVNKETKLDDNLKSVYFYYYAQALKNINDKEKAKEYILKALELSPSNEAYNFLYEQVK